MVSNHVPLPAHDVRGRCNWQNELQSESNCGDSFAHWPSSFECHPGWLGCLVRDPTFVYFWTSVRECVINVDTHRTALLLDTAPFFATAHSVDAMSWHRDIPWLEPESYWCSWGCVQINDQLFWDFPIICTQLGKSRTFTHRTKHDDIYLLVQIIKDVL